jgi:hypothetical protein
MNDKNITSNVEYAIWGIIPDDTEESLLCTRIESSEQAHLTRDELVNKFYITKPRIQTIVLDECPSKLWKAGLTNDQ